MSMNLVYQTLERVGSNFREFLTRGPKPKGPNGDGQVRTHKKGKKPKSTEAGSEASPPAKPNRDQLLNKCRGLAEEPRILDRVVENLRERGVTGEHRAVKLLYLALTSRLLDKIVSVAVKGLSSSGKSFVTEHVLRLFPDNAFWALTMMSPKALFHSKQPIKHRMIVLYEQVALQDEHIDYMVRSLLSEGKLRYEYTDMEKGGTQLLERQGPTGLITTTTRITLHPENETRMLPVPINDSSDQTRVVMKAEAAEAVGNIARLNTAGDFGQWHALQDWLRLGSRTVVIPFADQLAELIPPMAVRLRRDFPKLLSLIKAHAVLHQLNRATDSEGRVIATVADYAEVHELVEDLVATGIEASVPPKVRETVEEVKILNTAFGASTDGVSISQVADSLKLHRSTVKRRVDEALKAGYLVNHETRRGRPARLSIGEPLPEDVEVLPRPEMLDDSEGCCTVAG